MPEIFTAIEVCPKFIRAFSEPSPTSLPISFIDFLGTIPFVESEIASFKIDEAIANLCASVATVVIVLSSINKNSPFK